jgi:hypothetical protein
MSTFELSDTDLELNDLELILVKYKDLYLKELTYYGTSKTDKMFMLINLGQKLSSIEKNIIENFYNNYVKIVLNDFKNPNIYYLQKILFVSINIIINMVMLWILNESSGAGSESESDEFEYKSRYLVGSIENFVEKIIIPIETILKTIFSLNKTFKLEYPISYLKKFIIINKNKFTSKEKINKLESFIKLIE